MEFAFGSARKIKKYLFEDGGEKVY